MIPFTNEQKTAIKANEQNLRIIACAGSGKTATLLGIMKANPKKKILYILKPTMSSFSW